MQACFDAFRKPTVTDHSRQFFYAAAITIVIVVLAEICRLNLFSEALIEWAGINPLFLNTSFGFFISLLTLTAVCLVAFPRGRFWRYGLNFPTGKDWWTLLPVMLLAATAGGIYIPDQTIGFLKLPDIIIYVCMTIPLALELLFRGLGHGILTYRSEVQNAKSPWFFSYANVAAAVLYAVFIAYLDFSSTTFQGVAQILPAVKTVFAAFAFGLAGGFVRERSQSILPAVLFHSLTMICTLVALHLMG
jgi:membrane protease YdiL (CAAX protease family)